MQANFTAGLDILLKKRSINNHVFHCPFIKVIAQFIVNPLSLAATPCKLAALATTIVDCM